MLSLDFSLPLQNAIAIMRQAWPLFTVLIGLVIGVGILSKIGEAISHIRKKH